MSKKLAIFLAAALLCVIAGLIVAGAAAAGPPTNSGGGAAASTPSPAATGTPKTYYLSWYDSTAADGFSGDWIIIANLQDTGATAQVFFGNEATPRATLNIPAHGRQPVSWPEAMGGPVRVVSPGGATLAVTQRTIHDGTFNEVAAVEGGPAPDFGGNIDTDYYFTWYDSLPQDGMRGNWIMVTNVDQQPADVDIYIGGRKMGSYNIPAGGQIEPQYGNTMGGPVQVVSTNNQHLIVSQRVLWRGSFSEVTGMPAGRLDNIYYFTWYDMTRSSGMAGNWVLISNVGDATVHAQVFIGAGADPKGTYEIGPHQSVTPFYPELMDGPVRVVCSDCAPGNNILVSQRILYRDSFEEVQGTPPAGLAGQEYFGWYDFTGADRMNGDWLLIANEGVGSAAVDVYLGTSASPMGTYEIPEGGRVTPAYPGVMDGPVRVVSRGGQPLMVSQRVIYQNSFNELPGLTGPELGESPPAEPSMVLYKLNIYWASTADYENRQLSVDMRVANTGQGTAFNTDITSATATSGVTVLTSPLPALGNIAGGSHSDFTLKYQVPPGVTSFTTSVSGQCQDAGSQVIQFP